MSSFKSKPLVEIQKSIHIFEVSENTQKSGDVNILFWGCNYLKYAVFDSTENEKTICVWIY